MTPDPSRIFDRPLGDPLYNGQTGTDISGAEVGKINSRRTPNIWGFELKLKHRWADRLGTMGKQSRYSSNYSKGTPIFL